jgi:hypothetical protein
MPSGPFLLSSFRFTLLHRPSLLERLCTRMYALLNTLSLQAHVCQTRVSALSMRSK